MVFTAIRGRDGGSVNPLNIPDGLASECFNVELDGTCLAVKRLGWDVQTAANSFPNGSSPEVYLVHERANRGDVVFYGIDYGGGTNTVARLPLSGLTWSAAFTLSDNPGGEQTGSRGVAFHDKFFLAHNTAVDRLHVIDGDTTVLRRVGIAPPAAAPTVADTGSGSYTATQRWYQQSFRNISGTTVLAESERSASISFTPSGSGTHARVTKAATPSGETVTHWVLWASADSASGPFYEIAETAIGTTTYDDSATPSAYSSGTAAQVAGTFTVPTSAKYLLNDGGNRLLMAGAYEGVYKSRVWFTPTLGALGRGDDERIPATADFEYWLDIEEDNGGIITGLGGPLNGQPIVFKESQIWRLVPTGDADAPYAPRVISRSIGCIDQRTVAAGVDETGAPCLYFAAANGPYRIGPRGLQYIGFDIEDLWATRSSNRSSGDFYGKRRQYWLAFAIPTTNARVRFCADLGRPDETGRVRGGWIRDSNSATTPRFMAFTYPASDEPSRIYGHVGSLVRFDATTDDETAFQSYVDIPPRAPAGLGTRVRVGAPMLVAKSGSGTPTITVTQRKDYSAETRDATVALTTQLAHLRCEQGGGMTDCDVIGFRVGDGSALDVTWTIDAVVVPWEPLEDTLNI
jgi:hypothetical protein